MCGRYSLTKEPLAVLEELAGGGDGEAQAVAEPQASYGFTPRWNIAPTQPVAIVRARRPRPADERPRLVLGMMRWGLVPTWAADPSIGSRLINARAESAAEKPAFRDSFERRRCLVLADGFYEWRREAAPGGTSAKSARSGKSAKKGRGAPYYLRLRNGRDFAFAGLWSRWYDPADPQAEPLDSCTILTGPPNELVEPLHDRMPVILQPQSYHPWLDPDLHDRAALEAMLRQPFPANEMEAYPVSPYVNHADHEGPDCVAPAAANG